MIVAAFLLFPQALYAAPLAATRVIVLDAGHEPEEAMSRPAAATEKEFCLKIVTALKELIEKENGQAVTVVILSPADKELRQREKAAAANKAGGNVFLAIHAAPAGTKLKRGLGVYIPDPGDAPPASWRSTARNFAENNQRLSQKLKTALQTLYPESKVFSAAAPLYIFHGINMPAAAIETAGDGADEPGFFDRAAQSLYDALAEFEKR